MNEARGVPENVTSYAKLVFDKILEGLKNNKFKRKSLFDSSIFTSINAPIEFLKETKIVSIDDIQVKINYDFYSSEQIEKIIKKNTKLNIKSDGFVLIGLSINFEVEDELTKEYNFKLTKLTNPVLEINFLVSYNITQLEYTTHKLLNQFYDSSLSLIGHEIGHHVNMQAKGEDDLAYRAKYAVVSNPRKVTDIDVLNDFVFDLYYLTTIENIVRPSEFKTFIDSKKITKKQFLQVYYDSEMYKKFNICENITYDKLYNDIDNYLKTKLNPNFYNDNYKHISILFVLESTLIDIIKTGGEILQQIILEKMPNSSIAKQNKVFSKKFNTFVKRHFFIKSSQNKKPLPYSELYLTNDNLLGSIDAEKTYKAIIKDMNITATKMKKKIAKLYEDIPYEYEN